MSFIEIEEKVVRNPANKRGFFELIQTNFPNGKKEQYLSVQSSGKERLFVIQ